jgi:hypothetical protein
MVSRLQKAADGNIQRHLLPEDNHQHEEAQAKHAYKLMIPEIAGALLFCVDVRKEQKYEIKDKGTGNKQSLWKDGHFFLAHEIQSDRDVVQGKDQKDMDHHIARPVGSDLSVHDPVIKDLIAQEEPHDDQEGHSGKVQGVQ